MRDNDSTEILSLADSFIKKFIFIFLKYINNIEIDEVKHGKIVRPNPLERTLASII
jgi:hypothetical protein